MGWLKSICFQTPNCYFYELRDILLIPQMSSCFLPLHQQVETSLNNPLLYHQMPRPFQSVQLHHPVSMHHYINNLLNLPILPAKAPWHPVYSYVAGFLPMHWQDHALPSQSSREYSWRQLCSPHIPHHRHTPGQGILLTIYFRSKLDCWEQLCPGIYHIFRN